MGRIFCYFVRESYSRDARSRWDVFGIGKEIHLLFFIPFAFLSFFIVTLSIISSIIPLLFSFRFLIFKSSLFGQNKAVHSSNPHTHTHKQMVNGTETHENREIERQGDQEKQKRKKIGKEKKKWQVGLMV